MQRLRNLIVHLDIYIAIVVAVSSSIYAAVSQENNATILVILGSLTAILVVLLGMRTRLDELLARPTISPNAGLMSESLPANFDARVLKAKEAWITGIHRNDFLLVHTPTLERAVKQGVKLRFIFAKPKGTAIKMAAMRFPRVGDPTIDAMQVTQESQKLHKSIAAVHKLRGVAKSADVEIRTIDFLLPYGVILLDPDSDESIVFIEHYTFRTQGGHKKPKTEFPAHAQWHNLVATEIKELWGAATPAGVENVAS